VGVLQGSLGTYRVMRLRIAGWRLGTYRVKCPVISKLLTAKLIRFMSWPVRVRKGGFQVTYVI